MSYSTNNSVHYLVTAPFSLAVDDLKLHVPRGTVLWSPSKTHDFLWLRKEGASYKLNKESCLKPDDAHLEENEEAIRLASLMDAEVVAMYDAARSKQKKYKFKCSTTKGKHPEIGRIVTVTNYNKKKIVGYEPLSAKQQGINTEAVLESLDWLEDTGCETLSEARAKLKRLVKELPAHSLALKKVKEGIEEYIAWRADIIKATPIYEFEKVTGVVESKKLKRPKEDGKYTDRYYSVTIMIDKSGKQAAGNAWFHLGKTVYNEYSDTYSEAMGHKEEVVEPTTENIWKDSKEPVDISMLFNKFNVTKGRI